MNASGRRTAVFLVFITVVTGIYFFARQYSLDDYLEVLRGWLADLGPWGMPVFIILFALSIVFVFPMILIVFMLGVLFGPVLGIVVVSTGAAVGMSLCFFISRYLARERAAVWFARHEKFAQLDRLAKENAATVVVLTRLIPGFPFWLANYGFGLTAVSFKTYILWSCVGIFPCTVLYVLGANAMVDGISNGRVSTPLLFLVCGAGIFTVLVVRMAKGRLQKQEGVAEAEQN